MLAEKSELEIKKLRSSQIINKVMEQSIFRFMFHVPIMFSGSQCVDNFVFNDHHRLQVLITIYCHRII